MMKIHMKKGSSDEDETVLVQLDRRHTLKEDTNEKDSNKPRKTIRANSLGSFEEGHSSADIEAGTAEKQSGFARRPTVITESELSSSWLYKDRKAKINSDDESVEDPKSTGPCGNHEDLEPITLQDPKLKPIPVSNRRPRKCSSCCWYFTIVLLVCIACLVVMAGVGGMVYLEYFANHKDKDIADNDTSVKNDDPSTSKNIFQHPSRKQDNELRNVPKIPEDTLRDLIKNFTMLPRDTESRKMTVSPLKRKEDVLDNKDPTDSNNSKTKVLNRVESNSIFKNQVEKIERNKITEDLDVSQNIHGRINPFIVPVPDESVVIKPNDKNKDSLDLELNHQNVYKIHDEHADKINEKMTVNESIISVTSNLETEVLGSSKKTVVNERNLNDDETTTLQAINMTGERVNADISLQNLSKQNHIEPSVHRLSNGNSLDHIKTSIDDNPQNNFFDQRKPSFDNESADNSLDPTKHFIDNESADNLDHTEHLIDNKSADNSLDHTKHFIDNESNDNSLDHIEHSVGQGAKNNSSVQTELSNDKSLSNHNEDSSDLDSDDKTSERHSLVDDQNSDGRSSEGHSLVEDQNSDDSAQLVFIRPVVESKAIPIPLAFLRRIGFDIKNPNSHQPMTAQDMDIKFSLAEALKYLRSLDTEGKLPVSREKTITPKTSNQEASKKTKLSVKLEREEYLNILRKHIFEES